MSSHDSGRASLCAARHRWRFSDLWHRLRHGHWPSWGASYGMCGWYLTECENCGRWC